MAIRRAAVIGGGALGTGIAAQLANAGVEVELLGIPIPGNANPNALLESAIAGLLSTNPPQLLHRDNASRIRAGNMEANVDRLKDCDIIIEAVSEDLHVKSDLFRTIDAKRRPGAIVVSTASTFSLHELVAAQSDTFRKDCVIGHFSNPSRSTRLLELVTSGDTPPDLVKDLTLFMDEKMGKSVIHCKDTPGLISTRISTFWMRTAIGEAIKRKLSIEEADAIAGAPMGLPKTGVFGLADKFGLDLLSETARRIENRLPAADEYHLNKTPSVIDGMISNGFTGNRGKGGFYRLSDTGGKLSIDLQTGAVSSSRKAKMKAAGKARKKGLRGLIESRDNGGEYGWAVLKQTLTYTVAHAHELASDIHAIDQAMKLGHKWKQGPFEMIDSIGVDNLIKRLEADGEAVPDLLDKARGKTFYKTIGHKPHCMNQQGGYDEIKRPEGVLLLADIKRNKNNLVAKNLSASLWDIGDGVLCLEFHSKMNSLDFLIFGMMNKACDIIEKGKKGGKFKALVIHNEAADFSVGANLAMALYAAKANSPWY